MINFIEKKIFQFYFIHQSHYLQRNEADDKNKLIFFIILLVVTSQLALTIYLPSMPNMVLYFKTDSSHIQWTLIYYLIGYGLSQFFYGPWSDIKGRRRTILYGLLVFIIASAICMSAKSIQIFLVGRFLQGIGIGCGDTMGRAILCDRFKDKAFVKAACIIMMAATVTPMVAPVIGSYIESWSNWSLNFVIIFIYGVITFLIVFFFLPETKPNDFIGSQRINEILNTYLFILKNPIFLTFFVPGLVSFLGETIYNMMSSFLLQEQLHWDVVSFGWLNVLTVVGLLIGALLAHFLAPYTSYVKMVWWGMLAMTTAALLMLILTVTQPMNTFNLLFPMVIFMVGIGITYPNTNMGALIPFTTMAGTAGALQGGLQMLLGGIVSFLISHAPLHNQLPLSLSLSLITLTGLFIFVILCRFKRKS